MKKKYLKTPTIAIISMQLVVIAVLLLSACSKNTLQKEKIKPIVIEPKTRIVCVGNSVTAGFGLASPATQAWPSQLANLLGQKYALLNCGVSGTTMLKRAKSSYWNTAEFIKAKNFDPQILIISLGTNDAHPDNWIYKDDFYADYAEMIDGFRKNGKNPAIYVCFPLACYGDSKQIANLQNELIPLITQVSKSKNTSTIDFNTPTQNQRTSLYNDNLHPNAAGALILAKTAFKQLN